MPPASSWTPEVLIAIAGIVGAIVAALVGAWVGASMEKRAARAQSALEYRRELFSRAYVAFADAIDKAMGIGSTSRATSEELERLGPDLDPHLRAIELLGDDTLVEELHEIQSRINGVVYSAMRGQATESIRRELGERHVLLLKRLTREVSPK